MTAKFSYRDYVEDEAFLSDYNAYQRKYADEPRESDKVIIGIVREIIAARGEAAPAALLDIGCSTGNLLLHLKRQVPGLALNGGDLADSSLDACRNDPALDGIRFDRMDIMALPERRYDIVVANAVAVYFTWDEYERSLASVFAALKPGGAYIAFEWMHPFRHQDITIVETSLGHPEGLRIYFRPIPKVYELIRRCGFADAAFRPFELPMDLPFLGEEAEVVTYTRKDEDGRRMAFRGALFQPWCHVVARKG